MLTHPKYSVLTHPRYSVHTHHSFSVLTHPRYYMLIHPRYSVLPSLSIRQGDSLAEANQRSTRGFKHLRAITGFALHGEAMVPHFI